MSGLEMFLSDLVSIIVPVYNVEEYLEECITSIVNQSYKNIEVLLINDGSTDGSLNICKLWAKRDKRIRVISKENEGLGPTRNLGVKEAKGKWIAFIDADDWIDKKYVEKMYYTAIDSKAEMVTCGYYTVNMVTGEKAKYGKNSTIGIPYTENQQLIYMRSSICPQLCAKIVFDKYAIEQPNCKSQDFAVKLLMCVLAKKHIMIEDVLWFYRINRPNALTTSKQTNRLETVYAVKYLIKGFKDNGLFEQYESVLLLHILQVLGVRLMEAWKAEDDRKYEIIKNAYITILEKSFSNFKNVPILHIGGYNLMCIVRQLPYLQDVNLSFQFSSLISIMNPCGNQMEVLHKNKFRKNMIQRDKESTFWDIVNREKPVYLIMDLLEERHDILWGEYGAITKSDALEQTVFDFDRFMLIQNGSLEWYRLWIKSCEDFIKKIQDFMQLDHVIIVKNFLVEEYGDIYNKSIYANVELLRKKNETIGKCYQWMEKNYPKIQFVEASRKENYFTDANYEFGVYPWHLNTFVNERIAEDIKTKIEK